MGGAEGRGSQRGAEGRGSQRGAEGRGSQRGGEGRGNQRGAERARRRAERERNQERGRAERARNQRRGRAGNQERAEKEERKYQADLVVTCKCKPYRLNWMPSTHRKMHSRKRKTPPRNRLRLQ